MLKAENASGFVLIDKPQGITSFQALRPVKKVFGTKRVGHAGTLDQEASGLIVVAVGKSTRLLSWIEAMDKVYEFQLHLGRLTDTLEWVGDVIQEDPESARTLDQLCAVLPAFIGEIDQTPPVYSAIKIQGMRASDRALRGEDVVLEARRIRIDQIEILDSVEDQSARQSFRLRCACSKGTYIRSLGRDLGIALGTVACVSNIRRTALGSVSVKIASSSLENPQLIEPEQFLNWPTFKVDPKALADLRQGRRIAVQAPCLDHEGWAFAMFQNQSQVAGLVHHGYFDPKIALRDH